MTQGIDSERSNKNDGEITDFGGTSGGNGSIISAPAPFPASPSHLNSTGWLGDPEAGTPYPVMDY